MVALLTLLAQAQPSSGPIETQTEVTSWAFSVMAVVILLAGVILVLAVRRRQGKRVV